MQSSAVAAAPPCVEPAPASPTRMEEELAAPSTSTDKTDSMDVDGESKKLLGLGQKHLVMGNIPAAVNAFQEAASLLGKKYGETADECAEAFFYYGKSLLELARMENGVLGNALEGVQVEEEGEKAEDDSALPTVDEEAREELREQVYNAMGEKEEAKKPTEESPVLAEKEIKEEDVEMKEIAEEEPKEETIADKGVQLPEAEEKIEDSVEKVTSEEQKQQVAAEKEVTKEEAAVEEKVVEKEQKMVPEDKVAEATEKERMTEVLDKEAKAAVEEAEAGDAAVEEKGEVGEQTAEATEKDTAVEKGEAVEGQAEAAVEEKTVAQEVTAEEQAAVAVEQKEAAEGEAEAAEQKKVEEKQEPVETATEEKPNESKERESSKEPMPTEGKEPSDDMEEKAEVAAKVEKEEKKDDLMEEGEGAKVEKEEKDDLMEEGEETEESEEEDKENDKAEDKENELTVEDKSLQESEEDEIGNLELAWDMLELAKVIYKRQETKEAQLHAAQAHLKLGEVSIESENYTQAIEEFQACLALQQKYLEAHDRLLAESHYQLALAYHYNSQFDEAVLQFGKSVEVIDKRMAMLTERIKKAESGSPEDEKEIEELKGLLPEIKEKIEDSKESQKSAKVAELALKATLVGTTSGFAQSEDSGSVSTIPVRKAADGASQCVTDISHLVRKKTEKRPQAESGAAVESTV
ncbi:nuclear autoantigenic sperm protein isoform 2-T2 [Pluvialis apricaria]